MQELDLEQLRSNDSLHTNGKHDEQPISFLFSLLKDGYIITNLFKPGQPSGYCLAVDAKRLILAQKNSNEKSTFEYDVATEKLLKNKEPVDASFMAVFKNKISTVLGDLKNNKAVIRKAVL